MLSLASKDAEIADPPEATGASLLVQHQHLLLEHYGHKSMAVLPDDVFQHLLLRVSFLFAIMTICYISLNSGTHCFPTLELTLHLEQKFIKLKQDALRLMNVALAGKVCGQILSLFKYAFDYPESQESKEWCKELEELERHFETDEESLGEEFTMSKAEDAAEAAAQFTDAPPKAKRHRFGQCHDDLPDLLPLNKAVPVIPLTTIKPSKTGVPRAYYSDQEGSEGQSIYKCYLKHPGMETTCSYWSAQLSAMTTHIRQKHLKICIKCRLCSRRSYSTTAIAKHLKVIYRDQQNEWFDPTPLLEGDKIEVTDAVLAANLQEVENIKADPDAKEQDD